MDEGTASIKSPHSHDGRGLALGTIPPRALEASTAPHVDAFEAVRRAPGTGIQAVAFQMLGSTLDACGWDGGPLSVLIRLRGGYRCLSLALGVRHAHAHAVRAGRPGGPSGGPSGGGRGLDTIRIVAS